MDTISQGPTARPIAVAVNEVTNKIYIADHARGRIVVVNGNDNTILRGVLLGGNPLAMTDPLPRCVRAAAPWRASTPSLLRRKGTANLPAIP